MKYYLCVVVLSMSLISGCGNSSSAGENSADSEISDPATEIAYEVVSHGEQLNIRSQTTRVIQTATQYSDFLSTIPSASGEIPNPDFLIQDIVAIISNHPCMRMSVGSFVESNSGLELTVSWTIGSCGGSGQLLYRPYILIEVPNLNPELPLSVIFEKENSQVG